MDARAKGFRHLTSYGRSASENANKTGPVGKDFTFNSPVGMCMDREENVWVCDTGNNRVVILDRDLRTIRAILTCPQADGPAAAQKAFRMPFHVHPHPEKKQVYITDMGNQRVVVMNYAGGVFRFAFAFGDVAQPGFEPLQDPNGVTTVRNADGSYGIFVNDEFFHNEQEPMRNRCVRFDEDGHYVSEFRSVIEPDGVQSDLYWPQGISADRNGMLYIANTGNYEVIKCRADAVPDGNYCIPAEKDLVAHRFTVPAGIGMLNIMRFVTVIGERVFVPDHVANTISVYDLAGREITRIAGMAPGWNHGRDPLRSASDPLYYALEDATLVSPYVICQGEAEDIFLISEPFASRITKVRIPAFTAPQCAARFVTAVGGRRNQRGGHGLAPQFNCITSVIGLTPPVSQEQSAPPVEELPFYLKYNPLQRAFMQLSRGLMRQYQFLCGDRAARLTLASEQRRDLLKLNMDAGNWGIKLFRQAGEVFEAEHLPPGGVIVPGSLAMALYYPNTPLLGQVCPGTPILLVTNFNLGTVYLYQMGPLGNLLNYGLPFGIPGSGEGCLNGPQGLAVNDDGDVFVVDALNNRISKWQILQTGQVVFVRNFVWDKAGDAVERFTPTDVAIDAQQRLFVTDQFNNRICVFDSEGKSLWSYGTEGYWEEGQPQGERFMLPTSLAIDGDRLIVNDLVNRALKSFRIRDKTLDFESGISLFKLPVSEGGVWMPFFMYAQDGQLLIADSTYNLVQVFAY